MALKRHMQPVEPPAPQQIRALVGCWDLSAGYHPSLARGLPEMSGLPLFPTDEEYADLESLHLPVQLATHGHLVVKDDGYMAAMGDKDVWPLAPTFVRDLCGRVVHTGLTPLVSPPSIPLFPSGCADVPATVAGANLIENAAFFTVRRLESVAPQGVPLAGQPEYQLQTTYAEPAYYPYKLRVDTFYADGWRLPQVPRVFTRAGGQIEAQKAGQDFMQRWQQRPAGQGYEAFYEANDGAAWFESLFLQGCTVIPTFEACNGRYHVNEAFQATEVDAGRAVAGLHVVVEERDSDLPQGTILDVIEPGWAMQTMVTPAKVAVSNGKGFVAPEAPLPFVPNLKLPHPRLSTVWGATWLPTHPQHFAEPALWDWADSGHFVQVSGPVWDPLHYTYTSTLPLLRALRRPIDGNPYVFTLAPVLKDRFHPVIAPSWYDTFNERTAQQRRDDVSHPLHTSAIDQVMYAAPVATRGYHPLPLGLEYELDPAVFPHTNPCHQTRPCPAELEGRIMPKIELEMPLDTLMQHTVAVSDTQRQVWAEAEQTPRTNQKVNVGPVWLPHMPASALLVNVKRLFAGRVYRQTLQKVAERYNIPTLPASFYRFREAALSWRRLRYRLFTKYAAVWVKAWQQGLDLPTAETLVMQGEIGDSTPVQLARAHTLGVKAMPVQEALGLPSARRRAKIQGKRD